MSRKSTLSKGPVFTGLNKSIIGQGRLYRQNVSDVSTSSSACNHVIKARPVEPIRRSYRSPKPKIMTDMMMGDTEIQDHYGKEINQSMPVGHTRTFINGDGRHILKVVKHKSTEQGMQLKNANSNNVISAPNGEKQCTIVSSLCPQMQSVNQVLNILRTLTPKFADAIATAFEKSGAKNFTQFIEESNQENLTASKLLSTFTCPIQKASMPILENLITNNDLTSVDTRYFFELEIKTKSMKPLEMLMDLLRTVLVQGKNGLKSLIDCHDTGGSLGLVESNEHGDLISVGDVFASITSGKGRVPTMVQSPVLPLHQVYFALEPQTLRRSPTVRLNLTPRALGPSKMSVRHPEPRVVYLPSVCPTCSDTVLSARVMTEHLAGRCVLQNRPPPVTVTPTCEKCGLEHDDRRRKGRRCRVILCHVCGHRHYPDTCTVQCRYCDYFNPDRRRKMEHLRQAHPDVVATFRHVCDTCGVRFATEPGLRRHGRACRPRWLTCSVCGERHKGRQDMARHVTEAHSDLQNRNNLVRSVYRCPQCSADFSDRKTWRKHRQKHEDEHFGEMECCGRSFTTALSFRRHRTVVHRLFRCQHCPELPPFTHRRDFSRHCASHHPAQCAKCPDCQAVFQRASHLKIHRTMVRGGCVGAVYDSRKSRLQRATLRHKTTSSRRWVCCRLSFGSLAELREHCASVARLDGSDAMHSCEICDKKFLRYAHLHKHRTTQHRKTLKCPHCPVSVAWHHQLAAHLRVKHNVITHQLTGPVRRARKCATELELCVLCQKNVKKGHLRSHFRLAHPELPDEMAYSKIEVINVVTE